MLPTKTSRFLLSMTTAVLTASLPLVPVTAQAAAGSAQTYAYAFQDADVTQVLQEILGNGLGMNYRIDPRVNARISFRIEQRLTRDQLLAALESTLAQYNIVVVHEDGSLLIRPRDDAQSGVAVTSVAMRAGYQVRAIPVRYGSATEIAKALETLSHEKIVFFSSDSLGLIVLGGTSEELESATRTVGVFDQNTLSDTRIRFFPLTNTDATTMSGDLGRVLTQAGMSGVHLAPMKRMNGIFAFARSGDVLDRVGDFVRRLDVPSQDPTMKVTVYQPRGATAETLARTLNQVLGLSTGQDSGSTLSLDTARNSAPSSAAPSQAADAKPASTDAAVAPTDTTADTTATARGGDEGRIVADRNANLVIIAGPEALRVRALNVLNDIDREPTQVFIEASILEVTLNDEFSFGVDWSALKGAGAISNFTSDATNFPVAAPGLTVSYLKSDIKAAITALSSHSRVAVLSAPKIATRENVQAVLKIGDEVPIITQTSQSTTVGNAPVINSVSYKDTGVRLEVTPHVLANNRVALDVVQEVSSVQKTLTSGIDSPTIHQRNLQSSLIVPEDTIVALGGLISSSSDTGDTGAPGISRVPVIGNLFKSKTRSTGRTELIVLLKARVLRRDDAFAQVLGDLDADMKDLTVKGMVDVP